MMNSEFDKIGFKMAGEFVNFLYNIESREVYDPLFPGIRIEKFFANCGLVITHNELLNIVENKINEFELAIAKEQLNKAIADFKDYSELF